MFAEQIEKIKAEYTDKYVAVDPSVPELARFRELVGQVKTVNMSGRALVEFADYHLNSGWYDIDLDYLKVVDKPEAVEKKPPAAAKAPPKAAAGKGAPAAGEKKLSPLEMARMQGAGDAGSKAGTTPRPAAAKPAGKASTADILAAARGGAKSAATKPAEKKGKPSTADILAAARGGAKSAPLVAADKSSPTKSAPTEPAGKKDKPSTADILAAARGGVKSAAPAAAAKPSPAKSAPTESAENREKPSTADILAAARGGAASGAASTPAAEAEPPDRAAKAGAGKLDKSSMSVDDMLAYCRANDG